jgi:hypothetical protein
MTNLFRFSCCAIAILSAFVPGAAACNHAVRSDFNGDGRSDVAIYDPATGDWYIRQDDGSAVSVAMGYDNYAYPAPGDFDNDQIVDLAVYDGALKQWHVRFSSDASTTNLIGVTTNTVIPIVMDTSYGEGLDEFWLYSGENNIWYGLVDYIYYFPLDIGVPAGNPMKGDFGGDCFDDLIIVNGKRWTVYARPWDTLYEFSIRGTGNPIVGDFDGDGIADGGLYDSRRGVWTVRLTATAQTIKHRGHRGTQPVTGDYDGDGITDFGSYNPATSQWYFEYSSGTTATFSFGYPGVIAIGTGK